MARITRAAKTLIAAYGMAGGEMGSKKRSALRRERDEYRTAFDDRDDLGGLFEREATRRDDLRERAAEARRDKACASKQRYASRAEAEATIALSEAHGARGLSCYKCRYCRGWHLTSHPWKS